MMGWWKSFNGGSLLMMGWWKWSEEEKVRKKEERDLFQCELRSFIQKGKVQLEPTT